MENNNDFKSTIISLNSSKNQTLPNVNLDKLPPTPPPLPGTEKAIKIPTYKETKQKNSELNCIEKSQYANLPDKLINTMRREKKPFTYTPLSVGDNGKLDLNQIKSSRMKKRLIANMKDDYEEKDENKIESIDSSLQNNKNQDDLNFENNINILQIKQQPQSNENQYQQQQHQKFFPQIKSNNQFTTPLLNLKEDSSLNTYKQPTPPKRQISLNYNLNTSQNNSNEYFNNSNQEHDLNNNSNFYNTSNSNKIYDTSKTDKINIDQEIDNEKNYNSIFNKPISQTNYNSIPKLWSPAPITSQNLDLQSNELTYSLNNSNSNKFDSNQNVQPYTISIQNSSLPFRPQRQQSLIKNNVDKKPSDIIPINYKREEPIQSKSFKILQKLTQEIEDEIDQLNLIHNNKKSAKNEFEDIFPPYYGTLNHIEYPRVRGEHRIPIKVEIDNSPPISQYFSKAEQDWIFPNNSSLKSISNSFQQEFLNKKPTCQQQKIYDQHRYQGANIPSRTFRILQMLTEKDVSYF